MKLSYGNFKNSSFNQRYYGEKPRKCMMCGSEITAVGSDFYSKNFCSEECKKRYFSRV